MATWSLDPSHGELLLHTGVTGRAARMGHRLTMAMRSWRASVDWSGDTPTHAELTVDTDSLEILSGEGGLTPLGDTEKGVARSNALKSLDAGKFPRIRFVSDDITQTAGGYRLNGSVEIHGVTRPQAVEVAVEDTGDALRLSAQVRVLQTDFGVKLISLFLGAMKVSDDVRVDFHATHPK